MWSVFDCQYSIYSWSTILMCHFRLLFPPLVFIRFFFNDAFLRLCLWLVLHYFYYVFISLIYFIRSLLGKRIIPAHGHPLVMKHRKLFCYGLFIQFVHKKKTLTWLLSVSILVIISFTFISQSREIPKYDWLLVQQYIKKKKQMVCQIFQLQTLY